MNRSFSIIAFVMLALSATSFAQKADYRNFSIAPFYPNSAEIQRAEARAQRYWQKNHDRLAGKTRYLAVEATSVLPAEICEPLWPYLLNADSGAVFLSTLPSDQGFVQMECVMIFDTHSGHFVSRKGYLTVENPPRGTMARYEDYIACYIGTGHYL
jgi:hypothetical protein